MAPLPPSSSTAAGSPAAGSDPGLAGSSATHATRKRAFLARRGTRVALVGLLVLILALGAFAVFAVPRFFCGVVQSARHGLSCDVPLPAQAAFVSQSDVPGVQGITTEQWVYTIPGTTVHSVHDLYVQQLPADSWGCLHPTDAQTPRLGLFMANVFALSGNRTVRVVIRYANQPQGFEPTGDIQLLIQLSTFPTSTTSHTC